MDTVKICHPGVKMVAHRGASALERENTTAAFVAAGNRSYFGIETDVHRTADGQLVIIHDNSTGRVCAQDLPVEQSTLAELRALTLTDNHGLDTRGDLRLPTLEEYISVCKKYNKIAVLELKDRMDEQTVLQVMQVLEDMGYTASTVVISFDLDNLLTVRRHFPWQHMQYLTGDINDIPALVKTLTENRLGLDIYHGAYTPELAHAMHENGIEVNVWTVDTPEDAARVIALGVDYITTNILE